VDENYAESLRRYVDASAMLRYFTQRSRDRLRFFEKDIGVAQVRDIVYDHFNANQCNSSPSAYEPHYDAACEI